nr:GNAT family N-acetyltransferase [Salinimonas chungwhensis]
MKAKRICLRPHRLSDSKDVQRLAGEKIIAEMTANIPHPYADGVAKKWISNHAGRFKNREAITFAIQLSETREYIGTVSITQIDRFFGNLGYWIGTPYWGNGYCTEAACLIINYAFNEFGLKLLYARHLPENPASGNVIAKNGFEYKSHVLVGHRELLHYELSFWKW